jgi:hypothetical protein
MFFSICDPALHTPSYVLKNSPFLFVTSTYLMFSLSPIPSHANLTLPPSLFSLHTHTPHLIVCALASRHYPAPQSPTANSSPANSSLYEILLEEARQAAGDPLNWRKTLETCQAYLLLGVYMPPSTSKTFAEDRTFLFFGMAIR